MSETQDNFQTLLDAGAASVEIRGINNGMPFVTVPDGYRVNSLESMLSAPICKRGKILTTDAGSFIDYLNTHKQEKASTIYAEVDAEKSLCRLLAVIDDHAADRPQWRQLQCAFAPLRSVEWRRWLENDSKVMTQTAFATWLEDNLSDIAAVPGMPNGTEMLSMALGFEANSDKRLRSKVNLQSGGVSFEFVDRENDATRTTMQVFERFTLGLPVFDGSTSAYPLEARLKYREKSGDLSFWYELIRPDRVFKTAVAEELARIAEETMLPLLYGQPFAEKLF
ncbi:MAG: DUF2303 family protein [Rhodocyclaceae bacterium]